MLAQSGALAPTRTEGGSRMEWLPSGVQRGGLCGLSHVASH